MSAVDPRAVIPFPSVDALADDAPTFVSLYSGCGGLDLGFVAAGFRPLWANDFDQHACETYRGALGDHIAHGDIDSVSMPSFGKVDAVVGGPPCQGFSVAGQRRPDDPRSQHVFRFMDAVEEIDPTVFVLENVKALAVNARWEDVRTKLFMRAIELDYNPRLIVLNAVDYGVAQRRERMFLVGTKGPAIAVPEGTTTNQPVTVREALALLPRIGAAGNELSSAAKITPARNPVLRASAYRGSLLFNGKGRPLDPDDTAPTIPASMGGNATPIVDQGLLDGGSRDWVRSYHRGLLRGGPVREDVARTLRRISVSEAAVLQSFPVGMRFSGPQNAQYRQIGNAVPPLLAMHVARAVEACLHASSEVTEFAFA